MADLSMEHSGTPKRSGFNATWRERPGVGHCPDSAWPEASRHQARTVHAQARKGDLGTGGDLQDLVAQSQAVRQSLSRDDLKGG